MQPVRVLLALWIATILADPAPGCTTFCFGDPGHLVFGKNYDWSVDAGLLIVNQRGVAKRALVSDDEVGATWTSTYGSVTFNQYGRELPSGGINEAGLVVELMWLDATRYPDPDARPALGCLQWIQYQLDRCASVAEVIDSDGDVRITPQTAGRIHFLVADAGGTVAAIEFLDGTLRAHTGPALPVTVLTNHPYDVSMRYADRARAGETSTAGDGSLQRFARVAGHLDTAAADPDPVDRAFDMLDDAAQGDYTKWSIVYDIDRRVVHFRTQTAGRRRHLALDDLDFACGEPVRALDVNADLAGDLTAHLGRYTVEQNLATLTRGFREVAFLADVPDAALEALAHYPDALDCMAGAPSVTTTPPHTTRP